MLLYQPSLGLTWKYHTSSGQLDVVSLVTVQLNTNELLSYSVATTNDHKILITTNIGSSGQPSPLEIDTAVETLSTNLTKDQVRDRIRVLNIEYTVYLSVYKNSRLEGENISTTSKNSEITTS